MLNGGNVEVKVAKHDQQLKDHERRILIVEDKVDNLHDISASLKELIRQNERSEKRFEQITTVLDGMHTNLLSLNHDVKYLKEKQEIMDNKVSELEGEKINKLVDAKNRKTNLIYTVIGGVLVGVIVPFLLWWFGMNK